MTGTPTLPPGPTGLAGTAWRAVSVADEPVVAGREPTATFSASEVMGTTGCNSYGGSYTFSDGTITFGPQRMTLMACGGPIGEVESRFTAALTGATTASTDSEGQLVIGGTAGSIVFAPDPTADGS